MFSDFGIPATLHFVFYIQYCTVLGLHILREVKKIILGDSTRGGVIPPMRQGTSKVLELPATREEFQHWREVELPTITTAAVATCSPV